LPLAAKVHGKTINDPSLDLGVAERAFLQHYGSGAARRASGACSMSSGSVDPEVMALKAAVRVLFRAVTEHYENEIGFRSELRRRAAAMLEQEPIDGSAADAPEVRARAKEVLARLLSEGARS
jgi:hypothetical protein